MGNSEFFVVEVPSSFTFIGTTTTNLCTTNIFNCTLYNSNNNAIKVAASSNYATVGLAKEFTVTLNDQIYVSPTSFDFGNDYFLITTYTSSGLVIDDTDVQAVPSSKATFSRTCGGKCATCSGSNSSLCLSCYVSGSGYLPNVSYGGFTMMTSDNQCVDACGAGYYNGSGTCIRCSTPCQNCLNSTQCTSCAPNFYYASSNEVNNRCVGTCSIGTYANIATSTCDTCSMSCYSCSVLANNCTSCNGSLFLSGTQCVSSCPDGTFENAATNQCSVCDAGCQSTCGISATDCTACKTGYFRVSANSTQCVNSCPSGSVKNNATNVC